MTDLLQYTNLLLIPVLGWVIIVERRLTRIETILKLQNKKKK